MFALADCDKPVIAAVTGAAIGIGTTMLLHCDFAYVSDEARLAMPFVGLGLVPEFASSLLLPQLMGQARAAEKLLLGDPFTGADAVEYGLANAVLPAGEVVNHARRVAERFNSLPPGAVREAKKLLRGPQTEAIRQTIQTEAELFAARLRSPEAMEAFQAFFQKRKPDFSKFCMSLALKLVLAPLLVAQAVRTRKRAPVLPEPAGPRQGRVGQGDAELRLLIAGDSSAAGVGVAHQDQALAGHLSRALHRHTARPVRWALHAQSGLTTQQVFALLRAAAPPPADVAVVLSGVNDVIDLVPTRRAVQQRAAAGRLAAGRRARASRGVCAAAAGAPLSAAARTPAPRDGQRRAPPRRGAGALGGHARRCLAPRHRHGSRTLGHGRGRLPPRRAGVPRLRRSAGCAYRHAVTAARAAVVRSATRHAPVFQNHCQCRDCQRRSGAAAPDTPAG